MRFLQFLTMLAAALLFAACGSGGTTTATTRPAGPSAAGPVGPSAAGAAVACSGTGGQAVAIQNSAFNPASITVTTGATVTWTNNDSTAHTVTFDSGPDCGQLANGATKSATFSTAGSYAYHCTIHSFMKGTVVVQ